MKDKTLIMIVDDDPNIAQLVKLYLEKDGYDTVAYGRGDEALAAFRQNPPSLMILDIMLPGMDGWQVCRAVRQISQIPIIMLTAKEETFDKVLGLELGADDYMTKPFEAPELLARVRALTRRKGEMVIDTMEFGDLSLNLETHDLSCGDASAHLSKREFDVMRMLMSGTGRIVSKQDLLTRVWGADADASENSVEAYVSFLRKKIKHVKSKVEITTLRMLGYRLEVVDQAAEAR